MTDRGNGNLHPFPALKPHPRPTPPDPPPQIPLDIRTSECVLTHMSKRTILSDADTRRDDIVEAAVTVFAQHGYSATR